MDQIGRYRIIDELGRGATGVVYRAQDPAIGRIIAIKTIRLSDFTDESERERLRERLFREAQSAGVLSHPNIVTIYDIAEENGLAYIFMECVDGPSLEKILTSTQPLRNDIALSVLRQTAMALDYAHQKGIVHRDIKPANILVDDRANAKITDFGVAKIVSQQMTQSGVMMGTPNYMSPEQVQGHLVDGRADQFSLGVIAYEILTGEKPFLADQLPALLFRIVREDPVPPQRLNPTVGPQVETVLKKALSKNAKDRYASCAQFVETLVGALQQSSGWHPLPRSGAQNMPTVAGAVPPKLEAPNAPPPPPPRPPAPAHPETFEPAFVRQKPAEPRNSLLRSLVWMLIGIGLVGLVLFGAQKYLFDRGSEQAENPTSQTAENSGPKPSAIGQLPGDAPNAPASPQAPEKTSPEGQAPAPAEKKPAENTPPKPAPTPAAKPAPKPRAQTREDEEPPTPRQQERSGVPATNGSGLERSVQFLTDPPGALVVIDRNSSQSCRTPCMLSLIIGRHAVNVDLAGYRPYPRVFSVPQDGDVFLRLSKASGTLSVTSEPAGATIEVDGMVQSKRTPAVFNLAPGSYRIRVARSGASIDFDVQIRDGEFVNRRVDF